MLVVRAKAKAQIYSSLKGKNEKDGKGLNKVEHASEGQTHVLSAALKLVLCIVLMF